METRFLSYQVAVSTVDVEKGDTFVNSINDPISVNATAVNTINNGRRISTLAFDPSKIPKGFIKKEPSDSDYFHLETQTISEREGRYVCPTCDEPFDCQISLQIHMKVHVVKDEHAYSEESAASLQIESIMNSNSVKKPYLCIICNKRFHTDYNLTVHMDVHTGSTPFPCTLCDRRFMHGKNLHKHVRRVHNQDAADATSMCARVLRRSNTAENRLIVYTGERAKPFKCGLCSKTFRRLYRVKEHTRSHSGQKPFQCSVCAKMFSSSDILYRHIKRLHNAGLPLHKSHKLEEVHLDEHTTVIQVEEAQMTDPQQVTDDLTELTWLHAPVHAEIVDSVVVNPLHSTSTYYIDIRPECNENLEVQQEDAAEQPMEGNAFQCSLCSKTFCSIAELNRHIIIHKVQVPVKCDICDKTFKAESYLKRHMRIHSGEKPYVCSMCPKAFSRPYRLSNHMRTHTGEKPYQCIVCGKSFTVSDNMYRHIKKMHKGEGLQYAADTVKQIQEVNRIKKWE